MRKKYTHQRSRPTLAIAIHSLMYKNLRFLHFDIFIIFLLFHISRFRRLRYLKISVLYFQNCIIFSRIFHSHFANFFQNSLESNELPKLKVPFSLCVINTGIEFRFNQFDITYARFHWRNIFAQKLTTKQRNQVIENVLVKMRYRYFFESWKMERKTIVL